MDPLLLNVVDAVKELQQTDSKEALIEFITDEFGILKHPCSDCGTESIIFLDSEDQVYCLYCNKHIPDYVECKDPNCGGQGIVEEVYDRDGVCDERANCLKCGKEIPPESCWHDGVTGYNFHHVVVGEDEYGEDRFKPVCDRCYQMLYGGSPY